MTAATEPFVSGLLARANRQGMTVAAIARTARVTEATVRQVLDGRHRPCPTMQLNLAYAVGATPTELYREGGEG